MKRINLKNELAVQFANLKLLQKKDRLGLIETKDLFAGHNRITYIPETLAEEFQSFDLKTIYEKSTEGRTFQLGEKSKLIFKNRGPQVVRQKANFSSFSIPNRPEGDRIWEYWIKERSYHKDLRYERYWLDKHLKGAYGKLILQPSAKTTHSSQYPKYHLLRMLILKEFIECNKDQLDIVLIPDDIKIENNLTILGMAFYAEAKGRDSGGWEDTKFSFEEVETKVKEFDREFNK